MRDLASRLVEHGHRLAHPLWCVVRVSHGGLHGRVVEVLAGKPRPVEYATCVASPIEPPAGFEELPVAEKIAYVQALWDLIAGDPNDVPVPAWHKEVLKERLAEVRSGSTASRPWAEVRADLRARLRNL